MDKGDGVRLVGWAGGAGLSRKVRESQTPTPRCSHESRVAVYIGISYSDQLINHETRIANGNRESQEYKSVGTRQRSRLA